MSGGPPSARRAVVVAAGLALLVTAGCSGPTTRAGEPADRSLTVLAASSLTEPVAVLAERFESDHPGVAVSTGFESSATVAAQVVAGAPADVVATADAATMQRMVDESVLATSPQVFARNDLALVVPRGNPAAVTALADLQQTRYAACAPAVPCGALTTSLLEAAGVDAAPASREVDVKAVLTKVMLGSVDAGLVYASDVVAAGDRVEAVPLAGTVGTDYPVAVVEGTDEPDLARRFVELLLSDEGAGVLAEAGLRPRAAR